MRSPRRCVALLGIVATLTVGCSDLTKLNIDPQLVGDISGKSTLFPGSGNGGYEVDSYELMLDVSDDLTSFVGTATLTATATQDLQRFSLDMRDLDISLVVVEGLDSDYEVASPELIITVSDSIASGTQFLVSIEYQAKPMPYRPSGVPFSMGWDVEPGRQVLVHGFPGAAATIFPADEDVYDPARFQLSVTTSQVFTTTAPGTLVSTEIDGDRITYVWDTVTDVTSFAFSIGEHVVTDFDSSIPISIAVKPGDSPDRYVELVPKMLDFLQDLYGPFPYSNFGLSVIAGTPFALATSGRVFVRPLEPQEVLVHELAHQWIGTAVASDIENVGWMFEGLAHYTEVLWLEHEGTALEEAADRLLGGLGTSTRPLDEVDSLDDLLDAATYQRGALFYHALRLQIGDQPFFDTLRQMVARYSETPIRPNDLQHLAEELSGQDLTSFFDSWLSSESVPDLPDS